MAAAGRDPGTAPRRSTVVPASLSAAGRPRSHRRRTASVPGRPAERASGGTGGPAVGQRGLRPALVGVLGRCAARNPSPGSEPSGHRPRGPRTIPGRFAAGQQAIRPVGGRLDFGHRIVRSPVSGLQRSGEFPGRFRRRRFHGGDRSRLASVLGQAIGLRPLPQRSRQRPRAGRFLGAECVFPADAGPPHFSGPVRQSGGCGLPRRDGHPERRGDFLSRRRWPVAGGLSEVRPRTGSEERLAGRRQSASGIGSSAGRGTRFPHSRRQPGLGGIAALRFCRAGGRRRTS